MAGELGQKRGIQYGDLGNSITLTTTIFTFRTGSVTTAPRVTSLPVPTVVGMAINGRGGFLNVSIPSYRATVPSLVDSIATALAASIELPPPTATMPSQPTSLTNRAAFSTVVLTGLGSDFVEDLVSHLPLFERRDDALQQSGRNDALVGNDERLAGPECPSSSASLEALPNPQMILVV